MEEKKEQEGKIKVTDRRRFTADGEVKEEKTGAGADREGKEATGKSHSGGERPERKETKEGPGKEKIRLPEMDFSTFVFSLSTSAQVHLGEMADPATGKFEKNLPLAKQTIDILSMLQEKTKGNLTGDEEKLLDNVLYMLRMSFVEKSKKS